MIMGTGPSSALGLMVYGLGFNGRFNGLGFNGLGFNALGFNGLGFNGLGTGPLASLSGQFGQLRKPPARKKTRCPWGEAPVSPVPSREAGRSAEDAGATPPRARTPPCPRGRGRSVDG